MRSFSEMKEFIALSSIVIGMGIWGGTIDARVSTIEGDRSRRIPRTEAFQDQVIDRLARLEETGKQILKFMEKKTK